MTSAKMVTARRRPTIEIARLEKRGRWMNATDASANASGSAGGRGRFGGTWAATSTVRTTGMPNQGLGPVASIWIAPRPPGGSVTDDGLYRAVTRRSGSLTDTPALTLRFPTLTTVAMNVVEPPAVDVDGSTRTSSAAEEGATTSNSATTSATDVAPGSLIRTEARCSPEG